MNEQNATSRQLTLPPEDRVITAAPPTLESRIKTAIKKPGVLLSGAVRSIKGRDLETLVEEFSSDVTLVLGGLSDDQERLGHENDQLRQQIAALEKRLRELEKRQDAKPNREGLIRRLTWLSVTFFGGAALLYVLKFLLT